MPPRKGFLCVLELHIRAVTCPGVTLKAREDLYISACILGQHKKTSSVRAIFPLLFDEKLIFEKVYTDVVDPGDLVELFELDTAVLELIQTVPPVGEILATYEENTRDFLFPAPKLMCGQRGSVHEVLMKKTCGFTGIAPKLKFSTNCLISESLVHSKKAQKQDNLDWLHHASKDGTPQIRSSKKKTPSPERNRPCLATKTYEQPTIASLSRSPSPYTKRRMCELEQVRQRLAHLDLGPFDFRKESDRPPFVIRQAEPLPPSPDVHTWCRPRKNIKDAWSGTTCDPSLLGSYRPKNPKIIRSCYEKDFGGFSDSYDERLISSVAGRQFHPTRLLMHSAPPTLQKYYSTPMLNCFSLRERFRSGWTTPANGEEIHKRVKDILTTHSARQRLTFDESCLPKADSAKTRDSSKRGDSNKQEDVSCLYSFSNSELQSSSSIRQSNMVHLNNDDYWTSQAAEYKCKPHRAIFEDSLEKIYRNMYRKASESISKNK
ncbi:spermatogenesis-associated protein 6 isoform X2 [Rhineura floridana]|uniref:spermatogenesis-associated protein 6 isoform X2 n=1 Tax=Rhineura floridana TaxID=261503 RepID=UPI002AC8149C|nr:spermatogenesis-associated protein 6 isoform X2 [Rhineura floridana]